MASHSVRRKEVGGKEKKKEDPAMPPVQIKPEPEEMECTVSGRGRGGGGDWLIDNKGWSCGLADGREGGWVEKGCVHCVGRG